MKNAFLVLSMVLISLGCLGEGRKDLGLDVWTEEQEQPAQPEQPEQEQPQKEHPEDIDALTFHACHPDNLAPVDIRRNSAAQAALGLPEGFRYEDIRDGTARGFMGVDTRNNAANNVAFLAWKHPGTVTNLAALQQLAVAHAGTIAPGTTPLLSEAFASWDSTAPNAYSSSFTASGNMSAAGRVNDIANRLLRTKDKLPLLGENKTIQHIRAQYVRRSNGEVIVVMAVAVDNDYVNGSPGFFGLNDIAAGAVANHLDQTVVQCERAVSLRKKVDFLFVVDDSSSMASSQLRLGVASKAMAAALSNSTLDWRAALVTSSYHTNNYRNTGIIRGFTKEPRLLQAWLQNGGGNDYCNETTRVSTCRRSWVGTAELSCGITNQPNGSNDGCWVSTGGNSKEGMLGAARLALMDMNHKDAPAAVKLQEDADIVVIILSDTDDQTTALMASSDTTPVNWEPINYFVDFFMGRPSFAKQTETGANCSAVPPVNCNVVPPIRPMQVHAISCPFAQACGDPHKPRTNPTRIERVALTTGGSFTDIRPPETGQPDRIETAMANIVSNIISRAGVKTQKPFIGASLRVAVETPEGICKTNTADANEVNGSNVPRSRIHGFDYNGIEQTLFFFGNCQPKAGIESQVAFSYRAWLKPCKDDVRFVDDPAQEYCKGPFRCDTRSNACVCSGDFNNPEDPGRCGGLCTEDAPICDMLTCECVPGFQLS